MIKLTCQMLRDGDVRRAKNWAVDWIDENGVARHETFDTAAKAVDFILEVLSRRRQGATQNGVQCGVVQ